MTVIASLPAPSHLSEQVQTASALAPSTEQVQVEVTASQGGAAAVMQPPVPPTPPVEPGTPSLPPSQPPTGFQIGSGAIIPLTRDQVDALERRGDELSDQIQSAQSRRDDIARDLRDTNQPADRAGLEERLRFLDERIMTLERDIEANSAARASLEANYSGTSSSDDAQSSPSQSDQYDGVIAFMVLFPISLAIARSIWRRSSRRSTQAADSQSEARFVQLEQAIDTVAVEIERVAEGQRYVTRLLSEGQPIPDFAGGRAGEPVRVRASAEDAR